MPKPPANKKLPSVYLVVPVFNQKDLVLRFVNSVKQQDYQNFKLIIIDDASSDGTYDLLTKKHPEVITLKGTGKLWWSAGTNLGVKHALKAKADYILTINHDVTLDDGYISSLVRCAETHPDSLIGSMVVNRQKKDEVWFFGASYSKRTGQNEHTTGKISDFIKPTQSLWLTGMGVLVPAKVFAKIGYYDAQNFPLYFGDADFSERARRAGFSLWVNPDSRAYGDIDENWVGRNVRQPKLRFIYDLFTLTNSPFQWQTRHLYYKLYWPGNYRLALLKFYTIGSMSIYIGYGIGLLKRVIPLRKKEGEKT